MPISQTTNAADGNPDLWDRWNESGGPKYPHEKVVQFCFRNFAAADRPQTRMLDLGCGGGVHTTFLAREGFLATATDVSPVAIETTRRKLASEGLGADLLVQSAGAVDLPASSLDGVICVGVLEAAGPQVAAAAMARLFDILRPGGRGLFLFASDRDFRIQDQHNPWQLHGYSQQEVQASFDRGFAQLDIDRYITTYESGRYEQNDWLVTITR